MNVRSSVLCVFLIGCSHGRASPAAGTEAPPAGSPSIVHPMAPEIFASAAPEAPPVALASVAVAPLALAPVALPPAAPPSPCTSVPAINPSVLSATWPSRIGQHVRLSSRIERALELTEALLVAKGQRFVAVLAPDQTWEGEQSRTFTVMGSTTVHLNGQHALPQLMLETGEGCP